MLKVKAPTDAVRKAIIYQIHLRAFTKDGTPKLNSYNFCTIDFDKWDKEWSNDRQWS